MPRQRLFALTLLAVPAAATAQPLGVPACDALLDAYARCIASPEVPSAIRPSLAQGVTQMRSTFIDLLANPYSRRTIGAQCVQTHTAMRQSMTASLKCSFPAADPASATAETTLPASVAAEVQARTDQKAAEDASGRAARAAANRPSPEQQVTAKANAWVEAQNYVVKWHNFGKELADYQEVYSRNTPRPGAKAGDAAYYFNVSPLDNLIEKLRKAAAMPGAVPGVDEAGAKLADALDTLNPTIKRMVRYRSTQEYREDGFKLAREQHPIVIAGLQAAAQAAGKFSAALSERELARDRALLATLPDGSLPRLLLQTNLDAQQVIALHDQLAPRADTGPVQAAVSALSASTNALNTKLDAMRPKPPSYCFDYAGRMDSMIGNGRSLVRDIRAGSNPGSSSRSLVDDYNRSVDDLASCREKAENKG